jgi:hypothetical protein
MEVGFGLFAFRGKEKPVQSAFSYAANAIATQPRVVSKRIVKIRDLVKQFGGKWLEAGQNQG